MKNSPRDHLNAHTRAVRNMELQEAAITLLAQCRTVGSERAIAMLKKDQQVQLRRLDAAAAKLGAPYNYGGVTP